MSGPGTRPLGRFAPSPSGRMHLGNLYSCLLSWLSAHSAGGGVVLRLEDLDPERCRREYGEQLQRDLEWLGLSWEGEVLWQSQRGEFYREVFEDLRKRDLLYPCFCSRAQRLSASAPHTPEGAYRDPCCGLSPQEAERLSRERRPAWRVRVPDTVYAFRDRVQGDYGQNLREDCGDFILRRSDGVFAYQLAVVVDDAAMGVNEVVRGRDLLSSTPRQLYLQELLGLPRPSYAHIPLLLSPEGRRLSKRDRDLDVGVLREHMTPQEVLGLLGFLAGLLPQPQPVGLGELLERFDWSKVPREDLKIP